MWVTPTQHAVKSLLNYATIADQYVPVKLNFGKNNNVLNIFTDNKAKRIQCNLQHCIFEF